jgi:hypothetical protein
VDFINATIDSMIRFDSIHSGVKWHLTLFARRTTITPLSSRAIVACSRPTRATEYAEDDEMLRWILGWADRNCVCGNIVNFVLVIRRGRMLSNTDYSNSLACSKNISAFEISYLSSFESTIEDGSYNHSDLFIPLRPLQQFRRFFDQHSQHALLLEETATTHHDIRQRKFAVAYYSCPQRAGNFFHSFFNTVTWAMIQNRTLLWAYENKKNQEDDCQAVLKRAEWIPSYIEWKGRLKLPDPVSVSNNPSR